MSAWRLLLLAALPALVGVCAEDVVALGGGPAFLPARRALAAAPGGEAALACRVARLGDKAVSWVRARDMHILAHAGAVFSHDPRVRVAVARGAGHETHTLRLTRLDAGDAGRYECQLNTDPKLSQIFTLTVTDGPLPRLEVWSARARVVGAAGGAATLECAARLAPAPPDPPPLRLAWFRDGAPLQPQGGRAGGVALDTERSAGRASSRLTLAALAPADAGRYECRVRAPQAGDPDPDQGADEELRGETVITLDVLDNADVGSMEAMQRDASAPAAAPRCARAAAALAPLAAAALLARALLSL